MPKMQATTFPTIGSGILLGSITGIVKNHILAKLPKNYIKYTFIKNSIASVTEQEAGEEEILVKDKPALSLGLNYSYNDPVSFGDQKPWGVNRIPVNAHLYSSIYRNILINDVDHLYITTVDDRVKLNYDVGIKLDSESQAYNLMMYLRNHIGVGRPYYLQRVDLEFPLPVDCLNLIIRTKGFDITTEDGSRAFHDYLTVWSGGRVTYKRNLSSGNYNYFLKYNTNILCKIPDVPTIEKNVEGKSVLDVDLKFSIEVELFNFTNFITEHQKMDLNTLPTVPLLEDQGTSVVYNFTAQMPLARQLNDGKVLAVTLEFITDINTAVDVTSFASTLSPDLRYFIEHQKTLLAENPNAVTDHTKAIILRDAAVLAEGQDFDMDWEKYEMTLHNPLYNYVHTVAIYVDLLAYNRVIEARDNLYLNGAQAVREIQG